MLALRRQHTLGRGDLDWVRHDEEVLAFDRGEVSVLTNFGEEPVGLPAGARVLLSSSPLDADGLVPTDTTVWLSQPA